MKATRRIITAGAAASTAAALSLCGAVPARAAPASTPALPGTSITISSPNGDAMDPHVSGDWVSYTDDSTGLLAVHYYNLATGQDASIPNNGGNDSLSGVSGTNIVYDHEDNTGTFTITTYAIGSGNAPVALDPQPGSYRQTPAIGGDTVAWVDFTANPPTPQIMVYDTATQALTDLSNDPATANVQPAVSPDGNVVVWAKCESSGSPCNIWEGIRGSGGTWTTGPLTSGSNDTEQPHTDGTIVVYQSLRSGQQGIYWQPVGGGTEQQVPEPAGANYFQPHTSGGLISFQGAPADGTSNIYVYSIATQTTYQITSTPGTSNTLDDISVTPDGQARVVWEALTSPTQVDGFIFQAPQETPAGLCQLTVSDVENSAKYQALPPGAKAAINQVLTGICTVLQQITPKLTAKQLAALVALYDKAVAGLADGGWLTSSQAATLQYLAGHLTIT